MNLTDLSFADKNAAREYLEQARWPDGAHCPYCGEQHLHRYLAEFDFRYSNRSALHIDDTVRANAILKGAKAKRLTYKQPDSRLV